MFLAASPPLPAQATEEETKTTPGLKATGKAKAGKRVQLLDEEQKIEPDTATPTTAAERATLARAAADKAARISDEATRKAEAARAAADEAATRFATIKQEEAERIAAATAKRTAAEAMATTTANEPRKEARKKLLFYTRQLNFGPASGTIFAGSTVKLTPVGAALFGQLAIHPTANAPPRAGASPCERGVHPQAGANPR